MSTTKRQARHAGLLYLLLALSAPLGLLIVPGKVLVQGNAVATADNLRSAEGLVRMGIASELLHQAIVIFLVLALYRLFKPVDESLARQVVVLGALVSVPLVFGGPRRGWLSRRVSKVTTVTARWRPFPKPRSSADTFPAA